MATYTCYNCKKTSDTEDPDTNWVVLHKRNHKRMLGCKCGHGLYPGQFSSTVAHPDDVKDQIKQLQKAGIDPYKEISFKKKA